MRAGRRVGWRGKRWVGWWVGRRVERRAGMRAGMWVVWVWK